MSGKQNYGFARMEPIPSRLGLGGHLLFLDEGGTGGAPAQEPAGDAGVQDPPSAPAGDGAKTFTQADVDRIVKDRLEREKAAREKAAQKAKEEAEAEALKKNQEWQVLAEKNAARLAELEPVGEQVTRYKGALEKYLEAEKKDLPKHVLVLLEKLDPVEQIEYITANREELGKPKSNEGVPPSPNPKPRTLSEEEQARARSGQASLYSNF